MITKDEALSHPAASRFNKWLQGVLWQTPPATTEERLQRIETMGQRINGYVQFMCKIGSLRGTSAEAKHKAVAAFYERMVIVDRQLGGIQDDLRLG